MTKRKHLNCDRRSFCFQHFSLDLLMTTRRNFIQKSAAAAVSTLFLQPLTANGFFKPHAQLEKIGIQLFSLPKMLEKYFTGTLKMLAQLGYKEIEFYGPYSFSAPEDQARWNSVTTSLGFKGSGHFGKSVKEVKKLLDDLGLSTPSMHTGLASLKTQMGPMAEAAHLLGTKYVILPSAATQPNLDGYKSQADEFNAIGEAAKKEGIRFAYHNHGNGLQPIDGVVPLELVIGRTDPNLVFFQMDIYWTIAGGADPVTYFGKYPGRFRSMHIKDMSQKVRFSGDGGDSKQWIELFPFLTDAGSGVLDLPTILSAAKKSGVEHFVVERDLAPEPEVSLGKALKYVKGLAL
jgi:sugar phosphate isomerase/epimerase